MNMVRNLAQAKAPQRLAPSQGMLAFSPAEIRPFLHHKSAGPHHRRGILRLSGRQRRNGAEVGSETEVAMTADELRNLPEPPGGDKAVEALWWAARGEWDRAHACAQAGEGE